MRLILFDIDGTLLWTDGAGRRAIERALVAETGLAPRLGRYRFDGKTDPQIVWELLARGGDPNPGEPGRIRAVCRRYEALLEEELAVGGTQLLPGVERLLAALEHDARVVLGLLTGNLEGGAQLKLRAAGLDVARFQVGAFGSDSAHRPDLPAVAFERARARFGAAPDPALAVVVGDTPADIACGQAAGTRTVGVATGSFGLRALRRAGADHVFSNFEDVPRVLSALLD